MSLMLNNLPGLSVDWSIGAKKKKQLKNTMKGIKGEHTSTKYQEQRNSPMYQNRSNVQVVYQQGDISNHGNP